MFGFGIVLMHIANYFARLKYDKEKRSRKAKKGEPIYE